ncbi:MAG: tRNA (cytidine(34)-2'-O)-methyltransferase [Pseudomonadota bacterium]|nr:tRNA (cytidine(34)-2'-O)-methyltransferase [Pseudomonadota bacterium]
MFIALYQPEIPQNTGNIIRLCANTGLVLDLIEPLGFSLEDKQLRRAGLDYHEYASVKRYVDFGSFLKMKKDLRIIAFTTKADQNYTDCEFKKNDVFLFGPETRGLPTDILSQSDCSLRVPMLASSRSLNLSNTVSIVVYEALRQQGFPGLC